MIKYRVTLTEEERGRLSAIISKGSHGAQQYRNAYILLNCDESGLGEKIINEEVSRVLKVSMRMIDRVKQRFVEDGFEACLDRKPIIKTKAKKIDGEAEAHLIALSCGKAPEGFSKWSLRLLADKMVELKYVEDISYETIRKTFKKNELKPWKVKGWVIPPHQSSDFVANMEHLLDVYKRPYSQEFPVVCMDESPKQLITETRLPIPMKPGQDAREDFEYARCGVANIFLASEPLNGKRYVEVTERKTKTDWAKFIKQIADDWYPKATKITLVMDNLGTHKPAALYEAFEPKEAKRLRDRFEFVYTPKHGSWLNMAEIELNVLMGQCLNRRIDNIKKMQKEVLAWQTHRNNKEATINWQFTNDDARIKLKHLYPTILT
ncbi:IS630 family transposase [Mucilaginibacter paludis]|uniref:IS630 family transposase n=1 Tax=Mucilaginibacter paludis TaxID=423351 RepID=UPI000A2F050E|nr:IS630 family transposase [Mucilaginibacter paludis]